jgi:hypothetical protein
MPAVRKLRVVAASIRTAVGDNRRFVAFRDARNDLGYRYGDLDTAQIAQSAISYSANGSRSCDGG